MGEAEILILATMFMAAIAILPGTLGILMFTNKIAADDKGARYIYGKAFWMLAASIVPLFFAIRGAGPIGDASLLFKLGLGGIAGVLVFGFFMHTKLMFRPIRKPKFISMEQALDIFSPDEEVVGVIDKAGRPWAFIARLARRPHIVYQPEGDAPFLMTHCILAHSSMSYAMEGKLKDPRITITAALANNMVFYERTNKCSVIQLHNQSRNKELPLETVSTLACSLKAWQSLYPESKIWMRNIEWRDVFYLKLLARADVIDPDSPVMVYPLQHATDERLALKSQVVGLAIGNKSRTYPVALFKERPMIEDELNGTPVLLAAAFGGDYIQVFDRTLDGKTLTFVRNDEGGFADKESGSAWSVQGVCTSGQHAGKQLKSIPHYNKIFWYVWSDFNPGTEIYDAEAAPMTEMT